MSAMDPWERIQEHQRKRAQQEADRQHAESQQREWQARWQSVFEHLNSEALQALTRYLRSSAFGLWLDYMDLCLARVAWIHEQELWTDYELAAGHAFQVAAIQMLKRSLLGDITGLEQDLVAMDELRSRPALVDVLRDLRSQYADWCAGRFPSTPFMSQTELAAALRGRVPGFGKSGIASKLRSGELTIQARTKTAPDGKTFYARFQHRDAPQQHAVLRHVVAWMRENAPIGSSFSSGLWTADYS